MGWEEGGGEILVWGDEGSPGGIATSWLAWKARGVVPEVDVSERIVAMTARTALRWLKICRASCWRERRYVLYLWRFDSRWSMRGRVVSMVRSSEVVSEIAWSSALFISRIVVALGVVEDVSRRQRSASVLDGV